jgi:hypothetical protein
MTKRKTKTPVRKHRKKPVKTLFQIGSPTKEAWTVRKSILAIKDLAIDGLPEPTTDKEPEFVPTSLEGVKIDDQSLDSVKSQPYPTVGDIIKQDAAMISSLDLELANIEYPADWWQAFKARWFPKWIYEGGVVTEPAMIKLRLLRKKDLKPRSLISPESFVHPKDDYIKVWSEHMGPAKLEVDSGKLKPL